MKKARLKTTAFLLCVLPFALLAAAKRLGYIAIDPHRDAVLLPAVMAGGLIPLLVGIFLKRRGELPADPELGGSPSRSAGTLLILATSLAVWRWLAGIVFLVAILFIHIPRVPAEPVRSIGTVIVAAGISIGLMWGSGFMVRCARNETR